MPSMAVAARACELEQESAIFKKAKLNSIANSKTIVDKRLRPGGRQRKKSRNKMEKKILKLCPVFNALTAWILQSFAPQPPFLLIRACLALCFLFLPQMAVNEASVNKNSTFASTS